MNRGNALVNLKACGPGLSLGWIRGRERRECRRVGRAMVWLRRMLSWEESRRDKFLGWKERERGRRRTPWEAGRSLREPFEEIVWARKTKRQGWARGTTDMSVVGGWSPRRQVSSVLQQSEGVALNELGFPRLPAPRKGHERHANPCGLD
jgi:hypothetical protein